MVGEMVGDLGTGSATLSGDYVLRIRKVEGEKVFGEVEWTNRATTKSNLIGTFDGQRLTYGNGSLTVEGSHDRHPARDELPSGDQRRTGQDEVA